MCTCCGGARALDPTDDFMRMLHRMAEIGMARMERLHQQSEDEANARRAGPAVPELPSIDMALQRASRMTRLCMALALKFQAERLERDKQVAADHAVAEKKHKERRKRQIERVVKQAIDHEVAGREKSYDEDGDETEDPELYEMRRALAERLTDEDIERDLDRCPPGELIGRILREFGIELDQEFWRQHQGVLEAAGLTPPGSPDAEPDGVKAEDSKPPEPEPEVPKSAEATPEEAKPPEPEPEAPPKRNMDYYRSPEHQRELEEHRKRVIAREHHRLMFGRL